MREMKNSGVPWIGLIPKQWEVAPLWRTLRRRNEDNHPGELVLSLYRDLGIVPKDSRDDNHNVTSLDTTSYKFVRKGDFVINKMKAWQGSMAVSGYQGIVSPAYHVCEFINDKIYPQYLHYLLRNPSYLPEYDRLSTGLRVGQWDLSYDDFKNIPHLIPPYGEQLRIVDFLDRKCADIDNVLEKTKTSIEEYKKLKQSIINEAVTKGIRGLRPMKDCGIEWASSIPSEWEVKRVKRCINSYSKGNGITKDEVFVDGNTPCVRYGEIYSRYGNSFSECVSATKIEIQQSPQYVSKDDILCAATGELIEEIGKATAYVGNTPCLAGGDIIILRHNQNPVFLSYVLNSRYAQAQKSCTKTKLKVVHISASDICNVLIALPPLEEQHEIASYLDRKCSEIDSLIASKEMFIAELESYKKSLIYEYVTGKKEVPTEA